MHTLIMAGGSGTRFWPASRQARPKQLLPLLDGRSLLAATIDRVRGLSGIEHVWIVTNSQHAAAIREQLPEFPAAQILIEPEPRDTAPCIAWAMAHIEATDPGALVAVMPADHLIRDVAAFHELMQRGAALAGSSDRLVTFGIPPTYPATGFGYIERGNRIADHPGAFDVLRFREKPDQLTAQTFLSSGQFLWNSGIFVWSFASLHSAMQTADPALAASTTGMLEAARGHDEARLRSAFLATPKTSIDYAVMEHTDSVAVIEAHVGWSDLGSFTALGEVAPPDASDNVIATRDGSAAITLEAERCTVFAEGGGTVVLFGTSDLVVVRSGDLVMVCPRERADDLKELIRHLRQSGREDLL